MRRSCAHMMAILVFFAALGATAQELGQGLAKYRSGDFLGALRDLMPLAEQGNSTAQTVIGVIYADGLGVVRDNVAAASWMRRAAEQEQVLAQLNLGEMYERGQGVDQDLTEAARWYERAAHLGHEVAQFNLARMYEQALVSFRILVRQRNGTVAPPSRIMPPLKPVSVSCMPLDKESANFLAMLSSGSAERRSKGTHRRNTISDSCMYKVRA